MIKPITPHQILEKYWGYKTFKPNQENIINNILQEKDYMAILPTWFWKSICFQIPALINKNLTIVISPLLALMEDQVNNLRNILKKYKEESKVAYINSLLSYEEKQDAWNNVLANDVKILYVSPELFITDYFQDKIKDLIIDTIVFDEAHCITSYWKSWFREAYIQIGKTLKTLRYSKKFNTVAFTATCNNETETTIKNILCITWTETIKVSPIKENIEIFKHYFSTKKLAEEKLYQLCYSLKDIEWKIIIYPWSIKDSRAIVKQLKLLKISSRYFYSWFAPATKKSILEQFKKDKIKILVATSAFWMGIDVSDIRVIIHYMMPTDLEGYLQEIWRAWRDWEKSLSIILSCSKDIVTAKFMIKNNSNYSESYSKLEYMINFIKDSSINIKEAIESYFQ